MIKNRDIVMVGLAALDTRSGSNVINLAEVFSKQNRVLYVNYPLDRMTILRKRKNPVIQKRLKIIKGEIPDLKQVNDNLWSFYSISCPSIDCLIF